MATTTTPFPAVNVVPTGFKWSREAADKAEQKGLFIRVGGATVGKRYLSGAKRSWAHLDPEENQTVYSVENRITGTPENIRVALQYANFSPAEIDKVLAGVITSANYDKEMANKVEAELELRNRIKSVKPAVQSYEMPQIVWFAQNLKNAVISTKTGEQRVPVGSPGRAGAGESLVNKVNNLAPGKVLDVSGMDSNTGKGVRAVANPKTAKSGKYGSGGIPIISNNLEKYIRALELVYGADARTKYAAEIAIVTKALTGVGKAPSPRAGQNVAFPAPTRSPARAAPAAPTQSPRKGVAFATPTRSPPKVPGQNIAAAPVFTRASPGRAGAPVGTQGGGAFPALPPMRTLMTGNR